MIQMIFSAPKASAIKRNMSLKIVVLTAGLTNVGAGGGEAKHGP
jgi:hypothetical protein